MFFAFDRVVGICTCSAIALIFGKSFHNTFPRQQLIFLLLLPRFKLFFVVALPFFEEVDPFCPVFGKVLSKVAVVVLLGNLLNGLLYR